MILVVAHTRRVDVRAKTFVAEASGRLEAALVDFGFIGPEVDVEQGVYPLVMGVRYHRAEVTVETRLILAYAGEEYVQTLVRWSGVVSGGDRRVEVGSDIAHTGYQMRRALDRHSQAVPAVLKDSDRTV